MYTYAWFAILGVAVTRAQSPDLTQYVVPSTGISGGNTFAGVALPFGMVKCGADVYTGFDVYSGDVPSGNFTAFSLMHETGTGGAPKYGVVSQMPVIGEIDNPLEDLNDTRAAPDNSSVGYFGVFLGSGIKVELSATSRAGFYKHTFPSGNISNIVVDVSHVLPSYRKQGLSQSYVGGNISVSDDHYEGYGEYNNGWNRAPDWRIYFCGYFDTPATIKTFIGLDQNSSSLVDYSHASNAASSSRLGAVFSFNSTSVSLRVGISFISTAQACNNVNTQIPAGTTLESVVNNAKQIWNNEVLSKVTTTETNTQYLELLYTSMYHMHLLPSNRTGENPLWKSSEPYYDDTFTTWDLFRSTFSLYQIFQPVMHEEYVRSLIDIFRFEGYMPDARSSNFNGATQGGSNSDNVLADAYVKGVRGSVNWADGYQAMVKDAEVTPPNNDDPRDPSSSTKEGRGALPDWLQLGYITPKYGRSVTRAVEYSVNDFSLYQVATGLGKKSDATKYLSRSRNWRNHWNPEASSLNFTGFVVPRTTEGFLSQDPLSCGGCYWGDAYYEALPWEYTFNVHHDINTLVALSGGPEIFVAKLETVFKPHINTSGRSSAFNDTIFNPGNEPSFTTPYLYNLVGRQDLSVKQSRNIAKSYYAPTPGGLPGNSDAGAMESWLIWNILGLYPMVGQTTFLIGSPWFANTTIALGGEKSLALTAIGGSNSSFYVQSLKVNGKPWTQSWLTWNDVFADGGRMDFVLGLEPLNWSTGEAPPSPGSEFAQTADPTTIIKPGAVGMAPIRALQRERERKRRIMLRNIGIGLASFGVWALGLISSLYFWWFKFQVPRLENEDHEDQAQEEGMTKTNDQNSLNGSSKKPIKMYFFFWRKKHFLGPIGESKEVTKSISGDASSMVPKDGRDKRKKPLSINVIEGLSEPREPWTPRGTHNKTESQAH